MHATTGGVAPYVRFQPASAHSLCTAAQLRPEGLCPWLRNLVVSHIVVHQGCPLVSDVGVAGVLKRGDASLKR